MKAYDKTIKVVFACSKLQNRLPLSVLSEKILNILIYSLYYT